MSRINRSEGSHWSTTSSSASSVAQSLAESASRGRRASGELGSLAPRPLAPSSRAISRAPASSLGLGSHRDDLSQAGQPSSLTSSMRSRARRYEPSELPSHLPDEDAASEISEHASERSTGSRSTLSTAQENQIRQWLNASPVISTTPADWLLRSRAHNKVTAQIAARRPPCSRRCRCNPGHPGNPMPAPCPVSRSDPKGPGTPLPPASCPICPLGPVCPRIFRDRESDPPLRHCNGSRQLQSRPWLAWVPIAG